jgi:hypothetical protein
MTVMETKQPRSQKRTKKKEKEAENNRREGCTSMSQQQTKRSGTESTIEEQGKFEGVIEEAMGTITLYWLRLVSCGVVLWTALMSSYYIL